MEKRTLRHGSKLKICYLVERDRHPELHHFMKQLKKDDLPTHKKALKFIDKLKDNPKNFKVLGKFKKLQHEDELWELKSLMKHDSSAFIVQKTKFVLLTGIENKEKVISV